MNVRQAHADCSAMLKLLEEIDLQARTLERLAESVPDAMRGEGAQMLEELLLRSCERQRRGAEDARARTKRVLAQIREMEMAIQSQEG